MADAVELPTAIDGLVLRSLAIADAPSVAEFHAANSERLVRHSPGSEPPPSDLATVEAMVTAPPEGQLLLGVWLHGRLIGVDYLAPYDDDGRRCAGIGYGIDARHEGRGYSTAAVRAMSDHAFDVVGVELVTAVTSAGNPASRRVLEKAGFTLRSERDGWLRYGLSRDAR